MMLKKVAQLEEAWTQKDRFIHSSRMIIRFREDHISRLEKKVKAGQTSLSDTESQALIDQLKEEIKILSDQVKKRFNPSASLFDNCTGYMSDSTILERAGHIFNIFLFLIFVFFLFLTF